MKRNKYLAIAAAFGVIGSLVGCSGGSSKAPETSVSVKSEMVSAENRNEESGKLTVYTSVPQTMADTFQNAFVKKYPNIDMNVYRASSGEILTKMKTEKEAGQMGCDVVWVADFASADSLKELDLLEKYDSQEGKEIADSLKDPEGYYYGSRVINMVLAYNTKIEAPTSWNDLLSENLSEKVGIPSVSSGSAFQFVGTMVSNTDFGWDYFKKMKENGGVQFKANSDVLQRIATGEILAGAVLDYMVSDMKNQGSPVDFVIPEEGAIAVASPIAQVKGGKNADNAQLFIEYVLSEEGQTLLADLKTTPVRSGIETPDEVLSLDTTKFMMSDSAYISQNSNDIKNQFNTIFSE